MKVRDGCNKGCSNFLEGSLKAVRSMPANAILQEAIKLHKVSDSLLLLAEQHAPLQKRSRFSPAAFATRPTYWKYWLP